MPADLLPPPPQMMAVPHYRLIALIVGGSVTFAVLLILSNLTDYLVASLGGRSSGDSRGSPATEAR